MSYLRSKLASKVAHHLAKKLSMKTTDQQQTSYTGQHIFLSEMQVRWLFLLFFALIPNLPMEMFSETSQL